VRKNVEKPGRAFADQLVRGVSMKPTFVSTAAGHACTGLSIPSATTSISCCRPSVTQSQPQLFLQLALRSGTKFVHASSTSMDTQAYAHAITELKRDGELGRRCRCRRCPYLNNVVEKDHRFIKKRIAASLGFRSVQGALNTIDGYEAMHMIRKGQVRWLAKGDVLGQRAFIRCLFGVAA
jgi:hypothetical protein